MNKRYEIKVTMRFRRWSRTGYAAFRSLLHCVNIGFLKVAIADSSLHKLTGACAFQDKSNVIIAFDDNDEYDAGLLFGNTADGLLLQKQLIAVTEQKNEYAHRESVIYCYIPIFDG